MNHSYQFVAIALSLFALPSAWAQDVPSKQIAARTELHQIQLLTLSDQEFLKGDATGKQITIAGQLRIAQGIGRLPVVVLQHGSSGVCGKRRCMVEGTQ